MPKDILKIRIAFGKSVAMGPGKADLLGAIDACGSISAAAKQMNMSYRRAWELVDVMNQCFKQPVVMSASGGQHGGGAKLTEFGYTLLKNYRDLVAKSHAASAHELAQILANLKDTD